MALWDQTAYKQAVVRGYSGWLKALAPLSSIGVAWLTGAALPRVGEEVRSAYASLVCVAHEDAPAGAAVFGRLLREVYNLASARRFDYLLVGLDARDPLLKIVSAYPHVAYPSRLYLGTFLTGSNGDRLHEQLDDRPALRRHRHAVIAARASPDPSCPVRA